MSKKTKTRKPSGIDDITSETKPQSLSEPANISEQTPTSKTLATGKARLLEPQLMESNAPYPSIDEVESASTISLDSARTHVLEQMNCVSKSRQAMESPLATLNAQANAAKAIAELVKAKVEIFKAYKER